MSWNTHSGRNAGLELALKSIASLGFDLGILQETKSMRNIYMQSSAGYRVVATEAVSASQGGVVLFWREIDFLEVKEVVKRYYSASGDSGGTILHRGMLYLYSP